MLTRCYYVFICTWYNKDDNQQILSEVGTFRKDFNLAESQHLVNFWHVKIAPRCSKATLASLTHHPHLSCPSTVIRRTYWLPNASEEREVKVHRVKVTQFQLPSASSCLGTSRSPKQRWPCDNAMAGGTCTSWKQIFPPECQGYVESSFEFASIAEWLSITNMNSY